jgi:excisionase family DNA binding protein
MTFSSLPDDNSSFLYRVRDCDAHLAAYALEVIGTKPKQNLTVKITGIDESFSLSSPIVGLMYRVLEEVAQGHAVGVVSLEGDLDVQEAAGLLNVSEAYVYQLLERGVLEYSTDLGYRRPLLKAVLEYKSKVRIKVEHLP